MEHVQPTPAMATPAESTRSAAKPESKARTERIRIEQHSASGMLWFAGWLFTIGFLHLGFWNGVLALIAWPYFIGTAIAALMGG